MRDESAVLATEVDFAGGHAFAPSSTFSSFFMGGFECSTHRRMDGRRLDLLASTAHDSHAYEDYKQLVDIGIRSARDGLRWHLIECAPGRYDWSSFRKMLIDSKKAGMQVVWDLLHYGWPDDLDLFDSSFVERFGSFAQSAALIIEEHSDDAPFFCPVNEISFMAWAGGETGRMNPFMHGRGDAVKRQLVRASIAAIDAIRMVSPSARFIHAEPAIQVVGPTNADASRAAMNTLAQFEALDMLAGTLNSELGGNPQYVDLIGLNFYPLNQWMVDGGTIPLGHSSYKPLRNIISDYLQRYGKPIVISETGAEGTARPAWLYYVVREVLAAIQLGAQIEGICLYPITDYRGWDDGRICETGLLSERGDGPRTLFKPLVEELISSSELLRRVVGWRPDCPGV